DQVREIVSVTLGLRKAHRLRVRQPLRTLRIALADPTTVEPYTALVAAELNVKEVELLPLDGSTARRWGVTDQLSVNARAAGPRLGRTVQEVIRAARSGDWQRREDGVVVAGGVELLQGEYELRTVVGDGAGEDVAAAVLSDGGVLVLDLALDDE